MTDIPVSCSCESQHGGGVWVVGLSICWLVRLEAFFCEEDAHDYVHANVLHRMKECVILYCVSCYLHGYDTRTPHRTNF